ncbi:PAN2-PAN3 deadenylation complex catalytic subunit PAN2-like isoform X2 [Dysidea avara]
MSPSELRMTARTGLRCFAYKDNSKSGELQCIVGDQDASKVLIGYQENKLATFDLTKTTIVQEVDTEASPAILRQSETFTCVGDTSGNVVLLDPHTLQQQHNIHQHSTTVADMVVAGHIIATCGYPLNMFGHDGRLALYDVRAMRSLRPLSTMCLPSILRHVPSMGSTILVLSQAGEFQLVHMGGLVTPTTMHLYQINTETLPCYTADISLSGQVLVFGDAGGFIHNWSNVTSTDEEVVLNPYSNPTVFPDQVEAVPYMDFNNPDLGAPLSAAPLTLIPNRSLLSDWPIKNSKFVSRQPEPISSEILDNMKMVQFVGYAPKPANLLSNQCPYQLSRYNYKKTTEPESPMMRADNPLSIVPKPYRRVEIKYSKMGIEGFDFQHYNKTSFAGLEIHIPNAYCNAMLQVLYFLEPVCCSLRSHKCSREFCLACELNFLFRMLEQCQGENCQASNFLRTFRTIREASALGLVMSDVKCQQVDLGKIIQQWTSFVLQQLHQEIVSNKSTNSSSILHDMFATDVQMENVCSRCGKHFSRTTSEMNFPLIYPSSSSPPSQTLSLASLIPESLCRKQQTHMWCDECARYRPTKETRQIVNLPYTLCLTCQVDSDESHHFWSTQSTLPLSLYIRIDGEELVVLEDTCNDNQDGTSPTPKKSAIYDLVSVVGHVKDTTMDDSDDGGNLVAHIRVSPSYHLRKEGKEYTQWYMFNDFAVQQISEPEAATVDLRWYTPCVLMYAQRGLNLLFPEDSLKVVYQLDSSVLMTDKLRRTSSNVVQSPLTFTPLQIHEGLPRKGDVVAIDAEFVTLNQEEAELRSDGTHLTVKPSQLSVARVSVVRGEGTLEGTPFIDDYISTSEQVVDYLTRFSGIKPGDLDAHMSSKHLTTLKDTYLKLLYLVDAGVCFVGHGLKKDFRVINIKVPSSQVLDTVELFYLPNHRYISLKFLAWFFLGMTIQGGSHDSVEDARTALLLYRKYQQLTSKGDLAGHLRKLYDTGRERQWKVPGQ